MASGSSDRGNGVREGPECLSPGDCMPCWFLESGGSQSMRLGFPGSGGIGPDRGTTPPDNCYNQPTWYYIRDSASSSEMDNRNTAAFQPR